jgi:nicotinate phosphoribosyltransferase
MFDIISPEAIREGRATDAYFDRTVTTLADADRDPYVVTEVTADQFPTGEFELLAGVKDAANLFAGTDVDIDALPEGQLFDGGPVMRIEGQYTEFGRYETALLGFLSHASGIATKALTARRAAPDSQLLSFGARHVHPSMGAVVERSALIAGFDGFSHVAAGEVIDREASGTMPHALVICFGPNEQEAAWKAFDKAVPSDVPRIALCDTYSDETDEALRAARAIDLDGVRLDTPSARRGNFRDIAREVRWRLDKEGFEDVDIVLSGGLGAEELRELRDVADSFGVGGYVSNADPVDFALDPVEVEGKPAAKRGKLSGQKAVYRTPDGQQHVLPADHASPPDGDALLEPLVRNGEIVREFSIDDARNRALRDADTVGFGEE